MHISIHTSFSSRISESRRDLNILVYLFHLRPSVREAGHLMMTSFPWLGRLYGLLMSTFPSIEKYWKEARSRNNLNQLDFLLCCSGNRAQGNIKFTVPELIGASKNTVLRSYLYFVIFANQSTITSLERSWTLSFFSHLSDQ